MWLPVRGCANFFARSQHPPTANVTAVTILINCSMALSSKSEEVRQHHVCGQCQLTCNKDADDGRGRYHADHIHTTF